MIKLIPLVTACLLVALTAPAFASENHNSTNISRNVITEISNTNTNNNTNTNENKQSQKQKQENNQTQEVNITNNSAPAPVRLFRKPTVQPQTGVSPITIALMLGAIPLGLFLARHRARG